MQCVWIHYVALDVLTIVVCEIPVNGSLNCLLEEKSHNDHTQGMEREVESKRGMSLSKPLDNVITSTIHQN